MCNIKINHIVTSNWYGFCLFVWLNFHKFPLLSRYDEDRSDVKMMRNLWSAVVPCWRSTADPSQWNSTDHRKWHDEGQLCRAPCRKTKFLSSEKADELGLLWQNIILTWLGLWQYMPEPVEISLICVLERFSNFPEVCSKRSTEKVESLKQIWTFSEVRRTPLKRVQMQIRVTCETLKANLFSPFSPTCSPLLLSRS